MELDEGQANLLEFKKDNVRELAQIIKALLFREFAILYPHNTGLKITVDDGSCQQGNAYLDSSLFSSFKIREDSIRIKLPIKTLSECLGMSEGTSNSVKITYSGYYEPIRLLLEEHDGLSVRAKIHTLVPDEVLDFDFEDDQVIASALLKTQLLKEIFKEFDSSCRTVRITFAPRELSFATNGEVGNMKVSIPSKSLQMEKIDCSAMVAFDFRLALLQRMNPVFALASKVVLRVDGRGVLCSQFIIDHGENKQSFIEFFTVPDADGGEE